MNKADVVFKFWYGKTREIKIKKSVGTLNVAVFLLRVKIFFPIRLLNCRV